MLFEVVLCLFILLGSPEDMNYRAEWNGPSTMLPGINYDQTIDTPERLLGFPLGLRAASPAQIVHCIQVWSEQSKNMQLHEYARSFENRALNYLIISSPENLKQLDAYKADIQKLADPRKTEDMEAKKIMSRLPGIAWLAYSIHGNESSGSDSALGVIYHLLADKSEETRDLLDKLVVFIDPMMNPDGRARFHKKTEEQRGATPNFDSQSLLHTGEWPGGRTNHYYFDLNRDFILGVNPETVGRVKVVNQWYPQLFVDAHEMGSLSTYLFSPPREPINLHMPPKNHTWGSTFGRDQAKAFDQKGWTYFSGEWNDNWYPGYSFWCNYRGSLTILYEQARIHEDAIKRPEGTYHSYKESVHHQFLSSIANLRTLRIHYKQMRQDFWNDRKQVLSTKGPYANKTWVVLPSKNHSRIKSFLEKLDLQGFEYYQAESDIPGKTMVDQLGLRKKRTIPAGSILIPNRQPEARLLGTMMEFDPRIPMDTLKKERKEVITKNGSIMYDTTGWSFSMLFDLEAFLLEEELPENATPYKPPVWPSKSIAPSPLAWLIPGADDASLKAAAQFMQRGLQVRTATKDFEFDARKYARGTFLVLKGDNPGPAWDELCTEFNKETSFQIYPIQSGWGEGDLPDLGGRYFPLLSRPQIALVGHGRTSSYDYGSIWHSLDVNLGIRHSHLRENALNRADLRRYNVLIMPNRYGPLRKGFFDPVLEWVKGGGTLITVGGSSSALAKTGHKLIKTHLLEDVLNTLDDYELALYRHWMSTLDFSISETNIWEQAVATQNDYPWSGFQKRPKKEELKKRDTWDRMFMPQGALLAVQTNQEHWLTIGCRDYLPVMYSRGPVLMTQGEAPLRFGVLNKNTSTTRKLKSVEKGEKPENRAGWATIPEGYELRLRMSGLLWPEAARRIVNSAWVTRERIGKGQIIMFASSPNFRGSTYGSNRVLLNAVLLGPGLGSSGILNLD